MLLLIRSVRVDHINKDSHLHSTMLLLIPFCCVFCAECCRHLHSTMLLLIPNAVLFDYDGSVSFTFHYASTYTWHPIPCRDRFLYLHSTMLLLIHIPIAKSTKIGNIFTFHYASTYTMESIFYGHRAD